MDGQRSFVNVFSSFAYALMRKQCLGQSDFGSILHMVVTHRKLQSGVSISLILGPAIFITGFKSELDPVSLVSSALFSIFAPQLCSIFFMF